MDDRRLIDPDHPQERLDQAGKRRLADPAQAEGGHGNAELASRQDGVEALGQPARPAREWPLLRDHGVDPAGADLDQRKFGSDEEAVGGNQEDGEENPEEILSP